MTSPADIALLPDAGPLITLACADALDVLRKPGWSVMLVDMVLHEVTRNATPTSARLSAWVEGACLPIVSTSMFAHFRTASVTPGKNNLGELAIQEAMNQFALQAPPRVGVFLFEDHRIARSSFLVPANCRKVSTRAYLLFLEQQGWIASAAEIERRALQAGRAFSTLRFSP